ncbi:unnamed protein product [Adineta steineri]|uniref:Anoctamin n=1 Tax=Adineta steineri TaxID=433720 RepID=A0A815CZX0_9BILA|nr:unnamed protein product [Adineta steineri]CAF1296488.1 unnamed protein product [Adineta steineri]CAF1569108.1 unnamed protein product [Adineta steineri]CAF1573142.1 unnamed protein product [Adineta steineri]
MSSSSTFEPLVVLQFSSTIPDVTKEWVIKRLTASQEENDGADLLVRYDMDPESHNNILLIGATLHRLLIGAEELRIKKPYKQKTLREFLVSDIDHFDNSENPTNFLLKSEKQRIIWEEMQVIRPLEHEHFVPGFPTKAITPENDTILGLLRDMDFIVSIFPLHDKEDIKLIEHDWFMSKDSLFKSQDIHKVRNYFGENVAYYFAFLEFYTKALIPTALLGLILSFWPSSDFFKYSTFCIFNVIWWSIFIERWKRVSITLAYQWGTLDLQVFERPRSLYYGDLHRSPVTNQQERRYPTWKRSLKKYLVTYPITMFCLALTLWIYFTYYAIQKKTEKTYPLDKSIYLPRAKVMRLAPSIGYSLFVVPLNMVYKKLATYLTNYENHRLQSGYENNLTSKLFLFYFMNCFIGLFYEAFFNANYGNVAQLLTAFVIINAILLKFTEQIGPYIFKRVKKSQLVVNRAPTDAKVSDAVKQAKTLTPFEGTYSDYLTIFEQYGYVALFSAVFPWVTICALINNIFELRADAFKYCYVYQRPFAQPAWNIGSWHYAFDILSLVAIVTNTALIAMQPSVREYFSSYTDAEYILFFVAAEHVLLALKFAISFAIPDIPHEVQIAKAKSLYESNQALRRERERKALKAQESIMKS